MNIQLSHSETSECVDPSHADQYEEIGINKSDLKYAGQGRSLWSPGHSPGQAR